MDSQFLDPFPPFNDGGVTAEVGIGGGDVAEALVVAVVVIMVDESADLAFKVSGQIIVFQMNAVFQRLVPTLDLALGLRMIGGSTDMLHPVSISATRWCVSGGIGSAAVCSRDQKAVRRSPVTFELALEKVGVIQMQVTPDACLRFVISLNVAAISYLFGKGACVPSQPITPGLK